MKVKIEINGDNAAFYDEDESVCKEEFIRIIYGIADNFHDYSEGEKTNLRDINGNVCGFIEITE